MTAAADNPFSPPKAEVEDARRTRLLAERPQQVVYATALVWLSFATGLVSELFPSSAPPLPLPVQVFAWGFACAVTALVNVGVWRGRHWARVTYALLEFLGIAGVPLSLAARTVVSVALESFGLALGLVVVYLLFTKPGSLWFKYTGEQRA